MARFGALFIVYVVASALLGFGGNRLMDGLGYCFQGVQLSIVMCWAEYKWQVIAAAR